jgi:hypothetical protein
LPEGKEAELGAIFEEMARYHPAEAHWYLPLIGVGPAHQREKSFVSGTGIMSPLIANLPTDEYQSASTAWL